MPPQREQSEEPLIDKSTDNNQNNNNNEPTLPADSVQLDDKVYDIFKLAAQHPGGELFVKMFSGRDATEAFLSYHRREFPHERMANAFKAQNKRAKDEKADEDYLELCRLVEKVLPRNQSFAPPAYYLKVAVLLSLTLGLEIYIHSTRSYYWYLTGLQGLLFALVGLNIQHDANHGAISRFAPVNRVLGLTQNWIGGSAIDWIHQHVVQHHIHPNDVDQDPDIVGNEIIRLNPLKPLIKIHAFQYLYIFFLLAVFGLTFILFSLKHNLDGFHYTKYSKLVDRNRVFEEGTIVLFFLRWLVLPQLLAPSIYTLLNVLPMFMVGGYYLSFFFLISHNFEGALLFDKKFNASKDQSFLHKQVATAANVGGAWLCFFNGGLNYQIEHHLFPRVQHTYYPLIAPVVREFCERKGVKYVHFPTITDNVSSCINHLYQMGTRPLPTGYKSAGN